MGTARTAENASHGQVRPVGVIGRPVGRRFRADSTATNSANRIHPGLCEPRDQFHRLGFVASSRHLRLAIDQHWMPRALTKRRASA
jgi:hypothetical protein